MDSRVESADLPNDDSQWMPEAQGALGAMIELVHQLVANGSNLAPVDISHDIVLPEQQQGWLEQIEVRRLCGVFSVVLEQVGNAILTTLATYLSTLDQENTLNQFFCAIERIANSLYCVCDTSLIEAFRIRLLEEFSDEPF